MAFTKFPLQLLSLLILAKIIDCLEDVLLNPNEVFVFEIKKTIFGDKNLKNQSLLMTATINEMPDLPTNIYFKQNSPLENGYLYGYTDDDQDIEIEFLAKHLDTYEVLKSLLRLKFTTKDKSSKNQVEFQINNLNIEDFNEKKKEIEKIFKQIIWKNSSDLFITMIATPSDTGGRIPLNSKDKEGIVIRLSSKNKFSKELLNLDHETSRIKNRIPCLSNYKIMEYVFIKKNLQINWCSFKLIECSNCNSSFEIKSQSKN